MDNRSRRTVRFIAAEKTEAERATLSVPLMFSDSGPDQGEIADLAKSYLNGAIEAHISATGLSFGEGEAMPTAEVSSVQRSKLTQSSVVRFTQAAGKIPVFGSDMVVEVDQMGNLVGVLADIASAEGASPTPTLDAPAAVARVAAMAAADPSSIKLPADPTLTFYRDEEAEGGAEHLRLAWLIADVPLAPPKAASDDHKRRSHKPSPRARSARYDYLVDAHNGEILLHYSRTPCARDATLPVRCRGVDALGETREFYGAAVKGGFELRDPQRRLRTFDLQLGAIGESAAETALPSSPFHNERADFSQVNPAAITAHANAARVWDFYTSVLQRDSVDDEGMELVSLVNCTSTGDVGPDGDPREWFNAIWWEDRMWYGQMKDKTGQLRSVAMYLDIIGHELTHGVTERTAGLIYQGQSGALNESFSDILGIAILNWYKAGPDEPVTKWTWEIGPGWNGEGKPLRDLSDPGRTGDPAHMKDFWYTREDDGGVHTNSNIHNKAAYNVFTAKDAEGKLVFTPREVAVLYYLTLVRLPKRATFTRTLRGLLDVATTFYSIDEDERARKLRAIEDAYKKVGIRPDPA